MGKFGEIDSADTRAGKFPLVPMGGWAEGPACADTGARTPIGASGNFDTVDTFDILDTLDNLDTIDILDILDTLDTLDILDTLDTLDTLGALDNTYI